MRAVRVVRQVRLKAEGRVVPGRRRWKRLGMPRLCQEALMLRFFGLVATFTALAVALAAIVAVFGALVWCSIEPVIAEIKAGRRRP